VSHVERLEHELFDQRAKGLSRRIFEDDLTDLTAAARISAPEPGACTILTTGEFAGLAPCNICTSSGNAAPAA
jgi:hypothetical protein